MAGKTAWSLVNTCHSQRFRDDYTHEKAVYKYLVLILILRPMSHLRFYRAFCRATLSRDKVAAHNCACRTLQLCRINTHWLISLVSACLCDRVAVCDMHSCVLQVCRAIQLRDKTRDKIAGVASVKWHKSHRNSTPQRRQATVVVARMRCIDKAVFFYADW